MLALMSSILVSCVLVNSLAATNRVSPPRKVVELALGVSKAAYLPLDEDEKFIKAGQIMMEENVSKRRRKRWLWGQPEKKFVPACDSKEWSGKAWKISDTEALMFKNNEQKLVVFGFRGTDSFQDWGDNFDTSLISAIAGQKEFSIHKGFKERYDFIAQRFENEYREVPQDYTIVLTGHSLGAAEAAIAAVYAAEKLQRPPDAVVMFGSPMVGDASFKKAYEESVGCDRTIRMVASFDWIPFQPDAFLFGYLNYVHVCPETKVTVHSFNPHGIYKGYTEAVKEFRKTRGSEISFGCDVKLN